MMFMDSLSVEKDVDWHSIGVNQPLTYARDFGRYPLLTQPVLAGSTEKTGAEKRLLHHSPRKPVSSPPGRNHSPANGNFTRTGVVI
jgi:hypothetical protein